MEEYVSMIESAISKDPLFEEALSIAELNSLGGKIWLIGGFLYKSLLHEKHGLKNLIIKDYDFMLENQVPFEETKAPNGWNINQTYFGDARLTKGQKQVDIFPLDNACSFLSDEDLRNLPTQEKLDYYMLTSPFDIQAMVYDLYSKKIEDVGGLAAVEAKKISIIKLETCLDISKQRGITLEDYLVDKSRRMGIEITRPQQLKSTLQH